LGGHAVAPSGPELKADGAAGGRHGRLLADAGLALFLAIRGHAVDCFRTSRFALKQWPSTPVLEGVRTTEQAGMFRPYIRGHDGLVLIVGGHGR